MIPMVSPNIMIKAPTQILTSFSVSLDLFNNQITIITVIISMIYFQNPNVSKSESNPERENPYYTEI
jgi:hypothetical protein